MKWAVSIKLTLQNSDLASLVFIIPHSLILCLYYKPLFMIYKVTWLTCERHEKQEAAGIRPSHFCFYFLLRSCDHHGSFSFCEGQLVRKSTNTTEGGGGLDFYWPSTRGRTNQQSLGLRSITTSIAWNRSQEMNLFLIRVKESVNSDLCYSCL